MIWSDVLISFTSYCLCCILPPTSKAVKLFMSELMAGLYRFPKTWHRRSQGEWKYQSSSRKRRNQVAERERKISGQHKVWTAVRRRSIEYLSLSSLLLSCLWGLVGLWGALARRVGLQRQSYIWLSVITNQEEGYMGNYHWQLILEAYKGILDMSQWSPCFSEVSHPAEPPPCTCHALFQPCYWHNETHLIPPGLCLYIHMHIQSQTSLVLLSVRSLQGLYLCRNTSYFPLIPFDTD